MAAEAPRQLTRLAGLGAGGHARVVMEALALMGGFQVVELLDPERVGEVVDGVAVTGDDARLGDLRPAVDAVFIGVGGTGDTRPRESCFAVAGRHGFPVVTVVHPSAVVAPSALLGTGVQVLAAAVVGSHSRIGDNTVVNTGAVVDHDCSIGPHCHVATGASLAGGVELGSGAHVGVGASIRQGIKIGAGAVVGAGAAVVADVPPGTVVVGVPARELRRSGSTA